MPGPCRRHEAETLVHHGNLDWSLRVLLSVNVLVRAFVYSFNG